MQSEITWFKKTFMGHSYFNCKRVRVIIRSYQTWKSIFYHSCCGSLRITKKPQKQFRKCLFFGQSVIIDLPIRNWLSEFHSDDMPLRYWKCHSGHSSSLDQENIGGMWPPKKYLKISTWPQLIQIHNCRPLKKITKVRVSEAFGFFMPIVKKRNITYP